MQTPKTNAPETQKSNTANVNTANVKPANVDANQNEGEGSRSADQHYRDGVEKTVQSGKVPELAKQAKQAFEGAEGEELRKAEEMAKKQGQNVPSQKN